MIVNGEKEAKKVVRILKKKIKLESKSGLIFDLSNFSILNKGNYFKHLYTWEIADFKSKAYLLSIKNSYKRHNSSDRYIKSTINITDRYNAILIETAFNLKNLIIRPSNISEKIANLFLNFDIKLVNRNKFNKKYILESKADIQYLELFLTENIISKLNLVIGFSLEVNNSLILLKFENSINSHDSLKLFEIAKIIDLEVQKFS